MEAPQERDDQRKDKITKGNLKQEAEEERHCLNEENWKRSWRVGVESVGEFLRKQQVSMNENVCVVQALYQRALLWNCNSTTHVPPWLPGLDLKRHGNSS